MAHISVSPPVNSGTFSPLAKAYNRTSKDGSVPVVNFLLGSHYNTTIGNEMTFDSTGDISSDSISTTSGKLEIAAKSNDSFEVTKTATFAPFMYFYPGTKIVGHMETEDATLPSGQELIRYSFIDLATGDKIEIDFEPQPSTSRVILREIVGGVSNVLSTTNLTNTCNEINFELDFLEEGISKFYILNKTDAGSKTRVFSGNIEADIGEASLSIGYLTDLTGVKTVKSDFVWIFYPKIHIAYDVELTDRLNGRVRIWDTNNELSEADWDEVFSADHKFIGERVVENGIIRLWFKSTPGMELYGWNGASWALTGEVIPKTTQDDIATTLHDVLFERFNNSQCIIKAKYGIVDHTINIRRGTPYCRIAATSKKFRVNTTKERVALSSTNIPDFNLSNTDDTNRGNPLNLAVPVTTFTFTNDSDTDTGLLQLDDNYFSWYTTGQSSDTVGFIGFAERPIGAEITATDATTLSRLDWEFTNLAVVCLGTLTGNTASPVGGILPVFVISDQDTYVKYRANEGIWAFSQRMVMRRKR